MKLVPFFGNYVDSQGVLTQKDGDTGDSCQRNSTAVNLLKWLGFESEAAYLYDFTKKEFSVAAGRYRRTPYSNHWGSDPTCCSRDQHSIRDLCSAVMGDEKELVASSKDTLKRFGFYQNMLAGTDDIERRWKFPDIITPGVLSVWIRGLDLWPLYFVLYFLDLLWFFDIYIGRKQKPHDYDNMLAQNLFFAFKKYRTPFSSWALKSYVKTDYKERILIYHGEGNDCKPLGELYVKCAKKIEQELQDSSLIKLIFPEL